MDADATDARAPHPLVRRVHELLVVEPPRPLRRRERIARRVALPAVGLDDAHAAVDLVEPAALPRRDDRIAPDGGGPPAGDGPPRGPLHGCGTRGRARRSRRPSAQPPPARTPSRAAPRLRAHGGPAPRPRARGPRRDRARGGRLGGDRLRLLPDAAGARRCRIGRGRALLRGDRAVVRPSRPSGAARDPRRRVRVRGFGRQPPRPRARLPRLEHGDGRRDVGALSPPSDASAAHLRQCGPPRSARGLDPEDDAPGRGRAAARELGPDGRTAPKGEA